jgi:uncharacterized protein YndB with AHSA1/START domain
MAKMTSERKSADVDQFLPHPPPKVWRALTDPERLARRLMSTDFRAVAGTASPSGPGAAGLDGIVHREVLDLEPERLMRWSWRGGSLDSTVTWRLVAEGRGTRLFLRHEASARTIRGSATRSASGAAAGAPTSCGAWRPNWPHDQPISPSRSMKRPEPWPGPSVARVTIASVPSVTVCGPLCPLRSVAV